MKTLKTHKPELSKFGVSDLGLFGSYIRNEQSHKSDINILINFEPEKKTFDNYMTVYDLLESVFQDEKIEVIIKNSLSLHIDPKILNEVKYV